MSTSRNSITIRKPKRFNSPLYAAYELMKLKAYQFILFKGKAIQRVGNCWRAENKKGRWSRRWSEPLKAIVYVMQSTVRT
jgi:hypothetical protein